MPKFRDFALLGFLLILTLSCIDEIDLVTGDSTPNLVVEGRITNLEEPYTVNIFYSTDYNSDPNFFERGTPVQNANVLIHHVESGTSIPLRGDGKGTFTTLDPDFIGQIGSSYFLEIEIGGEVYRSSTVTIEPVSDIDSIYYEYFEDRGSVGVFVNSSDPSENGNSYQWIWNGFHRIRSTLPADPDTFDCCNVCFIPVEGHEINIYEDSYSNGNPILNQLITEVYLDLPIEYSVEVSQLSLDKDAYEYWHLLKQQRESQGGLFDPPPYKIQGNISNISNDNEEVHGYFSASAATRAFSQFTRFEFIKLPIYIEADCRNLHFAADTTKPVNWIE